MATMQDSSDTAQLATEIINRIRVVESKQTLFNERLLLINQNMIEEYKKFLMDIRGLRSEIEAMRADIKNIKNIVSHLSGEASEFARKEDVMVLEKYINLWNPLNFVTREEVERIIESKKGSQTKEGVKVAKPSTNG